MKNEKRNGKRTIVGPNDEGCILLASLVEITRLDQSSDAMKQQQFDYELKMTSVCNYECNFFLSFSFIFWLK